MIQSLANPIESSRLRFQARNRLRSMPSSALTTKRGRREALGNNSRVGEAPGRNFENYRSSNGSIRAYYPSKLEARPESSANVIFSPLWAIDGSNVTHGAMVGYLDLQSRRSVSTAEALDLIIGQLRLVNGYFHEERGQWYERQLAGEQAMATHLVGQTSEGYNERVLVVARPIGNGVLYMFLIAPDRDFKQYYPIFERMFDSFEVRG